MIYSKQQRDVPNIRYIMEINDIWYLPNKIKVRVATLISLKKALNTTILLVALRVCIIWRKH
jgi:hypothetical protein